MSEPSPIDTDLLISLYLDGDIEEQGFQQLNAWLKEDHAHVAYFVDRVADHCRTSELVSGEFNLPFLSPESESIFRDAPSAEADLPHIQYSAPGVMTKQKYAGALSYVLRHAFTPKRAAALAAAAAVLLACVLAVLLLTGPDQGPDQGPELAQTRQEPDENPYAAPAAQPAPAVATLTAQRDTDWANEILSPGTRLRAGERLTLIRGLAEITTNRGAVAVIEAPASIEFLDHNNAIRLHSGRLVGICETGLSKGFLVQTPHMAITDLGTEFCVDVSDNNTSTVHVLQGEVAVESARALRDEKPLYLTTGESASASARRPRARTTPQTPEHLGRFQNVSIQSITLRGTGAGLGIGSIDPNWEVVEANGRTLDRPERVEVIDPKFYKLPNRGQESWSASQMIGYKPGDGMPRDAAFVFETRFVIPDTFDAEAAALQLRYMADIYVQWVRINGQRIRLDREAHGWGGFVKSTIRDHLVQGENTIAFEVINASPRKTNTQADQGFVGLRLEWELEQARRLSPFTDMRDEPALIN